MNLKATLSHLFIPNRRNNFRAKLLHLDSLSIFITVACLLVALQTMTQAAVLGIATDIQIDRLYQLTNDQRTQNNLPALSMSPVLNDAARRKASYMFEKDYWAHTAPDGTSPWAFFNQAGYSYDIAGENLAKDFNDSGGVIQGLMNSPTHRANILKPEYTEIGFAVLNGKLQGEDTTLVVQLFGKPARALAKTTTKTQAAEPAKNPVLPTPTDIPQKVQTGTVMNSAVGKLSGISTQRTIGSYISGAITDTTYITIFILALAVILDIYYAYRLNLFRLSGKNIAHFMVLMVAIITFILFTKGATL